MTFNIVIGEYIKITIDPKLNVKAFGHQIYSYTVSRLTKRNSYRGKIIFPKKSRRFVFILVRSLSKRFFNMAALLHVSKNVLYIQKRFSYIKSTYKGLNGYED